MILVCQVLSKDLLECQKSLNDKGVFSYAVEVGGGRRIWPPLENYEGLYCVYVGKDSDRERAEEVLFP